MRVLLTADLHYNHARSKPLAETLIDEINREPFDVLVIVGDTAVADGDDLERCLSRFTFAGPKLFVAGNHELWTRSADSHALFVEDLPRRVRALGWHWLEGDAWRAGDVAIVGSVGWYDFSFAAESLGIPNRFYAAKMSPGAAEYLHDPLKLLDNADDISPHGREVVARWNDGKFVKLHRSDDAFLTDRLDVLRQQLDRVASAKHVIAAVHHLPFRELLPPPHSAQWDFAKAYLGSERIGQLLQTFPNVQHVYCGHSHFAREAVIGPVTAINIGSGYRAKHFVTLEV